MKSEKKIINDEIDLISIFSVIFDNFNILIATFLSSFLIVAVYYFSATSLYQSKSLLEIKNENNSFLPNSLLTGFDSLDTQKSIQAEIEIYKSNDTVQDALSFIKDRTDIPDSFLQLSVNDVRKNLRVETSSQSLIEIRYSSSNQDFTQTLLDLLNKEYIEDRQNYIKQSSTAGINFIQKEIPRIQNLLKEAEDNLNDFKVSTNTSDFIFDTNNRNQKLERLKSRLDEITFKEFELKEFYRETHPIYLTLSEQKKLVESQIAQIEDDLPNIPSNQRTLENFKKS